MITTDEYYELFAEEPLIELFWPPHPEPVMWNDFLELAIKITKEIEGVPREQALKKLYECRKWMEA